MAKEDDEGIGARNWSREETLDLLSIWADQNIQRMLETGNQNSQKNAWHAIVKDFKKRGYNRSKVQVKGKLKRLRLEYEKEAAVFRPTGSEGGEHDFEFWDEMHPILSSRHSSNPPNIQDSGITPSVDKKSEAEINIGDSSDADASGDTSAIDADTDNQSNFNRSPRDDHEIDVEENRLALDVDKKRGKIFHLIDFCQLFLKKIPYYGLVQQVFLIFCLGKKKKKDSIISYNPYRKRGKRDNELSSVDKMIAAMQKMEERATERDERRDRQFMEYLERSTETQNRLIKSLIDVLKPPPQQQQQQPSPQVQRSTSFNSGGMFRRQNQFGGSDFIIDGDKSYQSLY